MKNPLNIAEIKPTKTMIEKAEDLNEGPIVYVYSDENTILMETQKGKDPFVWAGRQLEKNDRASGLEEGYPYVYHLESLF